MIYFFFVREKLNGPINMSTCRTFVVVNISSIRFLLSLFQDVLKVLRGNDAVKTMLKVWKIKFLLQLFFECFILCLNLLFWFLVAPF